MDDMAAQQRLDFLVGEIVAKRIQLRSPVKEAVEAIRLAASLGYSSGQVAMMLRATSRAAVLGMAHRAVPMIKFHATMRANLGHRTGTRPALDYPTAKAPPKKPRPAPSASLSTHHGRLGDLIDAGQPAGTDDPLLKIKCPACGAAPGFRCTASSGGKQYATRTHKERSALGTQTAWQRELERAARRRGQRLMAAQDLRCMWFECTEPSLDGRPYCAVHSRRAGHLPPLPADMERTS